MNFFSYPFIDPVLIRVGPLEVRWYGLMYLARFRMRLPGHQVRAKT